MTVSHTRGGILVLPVFLFVFTLLMSCQNQEMNTNVRERNSIDLAWRFIQEDVQGAERTDFDDSAWRKVDVPHDWSIEGEYKESNPSGTAGAFLPTGIGWYRKSLNVDKLNSDEKYFIEFDGVYMNSDVWINGHHLGNRPYGYISFSYDLTPWLREGENILAVRVDHSKVPSGRWYTGSGIYRHVWLTRTSNIYVPQWGTFVTTPTVSKDEASLRLQLEIRNETGEEVKARVESSVIDNEGNVIASDDSKINLNESAQLEQQFRIRSPRLWSPDHPYMYSIQTSIFFKGELKDQYSTPVGIRSIELKGSEGFFLNGETIKFKGLSNHHDAGPVGAAVPDDVMHYRLKLLKEMGCNALRTAHNPFSPTFYTMCDTMGFMVMDEAFDGWWTAKAEYDYGNYFEEWWQQDLADFIKRDRNHPSVVIWSIGNEVRGFNDDQQKEIVELVKKHDRSRPVTQGGSYSAPYIDIAGFNGHGEFRGVLEKYHEENPEKAIIGTEITHTLQTRGVYRSRTWYRTKDNPAPWEKPKDFERMEPRVYKIPHLAEVEVFPGITKKYQSSYDNSIVRIGIRDDWNRVEEYDYYLGNFRWTGFDYLGESFAWPARTANFGIIDLAGFPKDHYFLYQSLWSDKPMVHLLPHWTHPGMEGIKIPVVVYTNCETAELFLNGESLGEKIMGAERQLVWQVPYESGEIEVVARNSGKEESRKSYRTALEPSVLNLHSDKSKVSVNRASVVRIEIQVADEHGTMVPDADNLIQFEISGPAELLGVENGDILDLSPHNVPLRKTFKGKCLLMIRPGGEAGMITVKASSPGLKDGLVEIMAE